MLFFSRPIAMLLHICSLHSYELPNTRKRQINGIPIYEKSSSHVDIEDNADIQFYLDQLNPPQSVISLSFCLVPDPGADGETNARWAQVAIRIPDLTRFSNLQKVTIDVGYPVVSHDASPEADIYINRLGFNDAKNRLLNTSSGCLRLPKSVWMFAMRNGNLNSGLKFGCRSREVSTILWSLLKHGIVIPYRTSQTSSQTTSLATYQPRYCATLRMESPRIHLSTLAVQRIYSYMGELPPAILALHPEGVIPPRTERRRIYLPPLAVQLICSYFGEITPAILALHHARVLGQVGWVSTRGNNQNDATLMMQSTRLNDLTIIPSFQIQHATVFYRSQGYDERGKDYYREMKALGGEDVDINPDPYRMECIKTALVQYCEKRQSHFHPIREVNEFLY